MESRKRKIHFSIELQLVFPYGKFCFVFCHLVGALTFMHTHTVTHTHTAWKIVVDCTVSSLRLSQMKNSIFHRRYAHNRKCPYPFNCMFISFSRRSSNLICPETHSFAKHNRYYRIHKIYNVDGWYREFCLFEQNEHQIVINWEKWRKTKRLTVEKRVPCSEKSLLGVCVCVWVCIQLFNIIKVQEKRSPCGACVCVCVVCRVWNLNFICGGRRNV